MDDAGDKERPYWDLLPPSQQRLLRPNLLHVLEVVSENKIGPEDFAQELASDLTHQSEPVLFTLTRGRPKPINIRHRCRFNAAQKKTFLRLIAPYRWKKRKERIVPYADDRWIDYETDCIHRHYKGDDEPVEEMIQSTSRRLRRYHHEFQDHRRPDVHGNRVEEQMAARIDLLHLWEMLDRTFPEPVIHAALGLITAAEAARSLHMRKSTALSLIRQAKSRLPWKETRKY